MPTTNSKEMQLSNQCNASMSSSQDNLTTSLPSGSSVESTRHILLPSDTLTSHDEVTHYRRPRSVTMSSCNNLCDKITAPDEDGGGDQQATWMRFNRQLCHHHHHHHINSEMYRIRSYSVTAKGVTKCGETLRIRHISQQSGTCSTFSLGSSGGGGSICSSPRHRSWSYASSSSSSGFSEGTTGAIVSSYRVVVMGAADVGKMSLVSQFVNSSMKNNSQGFDHSTLPEKYISILLDDEESEMNFIHMTVKKEMTLEDLEAMSDIDAFVVVYSVADRRSFNIASRLLSLLQAGDFIQDKVAVILVGNKIDLERSRCISKTEGRDLATSCGCKFVETSDWINHNVDELLVGILHQIRLKQKQRFLSEEKLSSHKCKRRSRSRSKTLPPPSPLVDSTGQEMPSTNIRRSRSLVRDFFRKFQSANSARSCNNLHIL